MSTDLYWIAVAVVTVLSAARLTRLAVADDFPPVKFFRDLVYDALDKGPRRRQWQIITWCAYCAAFWLTALVVVFADLMGVLDGKTAWGTSGELSQPLWWIFNGTVAGSYLAAIVVRFDGDTSGDDS